MVAAALLVAALGYAWLWRGRSTTAPPEIKSLAVLPLENLSGDAAQDYLADMMTDEMITVLAKIKALRVLPRPAVMKYRGKHPTSLEAASRAGKAISVRSAPLNSKRERSMKALSRSRIAPFL